MASQVPAFAESVKQKLSAEELKALEKVRWHDRLTSLWAPVTVFGLIFLVYLVIVETWVCSYLTLQPVMKALGLLAFIWWVALVVMRFAWRSWDRARKARLQAEEVMHDLEVAVKKRGAGLKDKARDDLVEKSATLLKRLPAQPEGLLESAKALRDALDKHLPQGKGSSMFDAGSGFVKALAIALLVRSVALEPFKIPSGSMLPTLQIGDQIFVNKFIYGVRVPFTNWVPFQIVRAPKRGDVIVFNNPVFPDRDYIKRIIGVAGDRIEIHGAEVVINGQQLQRTIVDPAYPVWDQSSPEGLVPWMKTWFTDDWAVGDRELSKESIDGVQHYVLHEGMVAPEPEGAIVVPPGHVFVMGDNRDNSLDSRFGLGDPRLGVQFVPLGNIKGKAMVIWLALGRGGIGSSIFGGTGFRTDRLFQPVTMCGAETALPK